MSPFIGFAAAIVSMVMWGSYYVPMKRIKEYEPLWYQFLICLAVFASSLIISLLYRSFIFSFFGLISGILWSFGNVLSIFAIRKTSLSVAAPIWMGTGVLISFTWGLFFFHEPLRLLFLAIVAIILFLAGIVLISQNNNSKAKSSLVGILMALAGGLIFGSYLVPLKLSHLSAISFLFSMSLGIFLGGLLVLAIARPKIDANIIIPGLLSGLMWNVANFASFFAILGLGLSIGFPLTQMALFVSVLWGLLYFKEIKGRKNIVKILISAFLLFTGSILLSLSK